MSKLEDDLEEALHGVGFNHFRLCDCDPALSDLIMAFRRAGWTPACERGEDCPDSAGGRGTMSRELIDVACQQHHETDRAFLVSDDGEELGHLLLDGSAEIDALRRLRRALARGAIPMSEPCKHEHTEMGFGLAGGGYGAYCYCEDCGVILEKWQESDDTEPDTPQP